MKKLTKKDKINEARAKVRKHEAAGNFTMAQVWRMEVLRLSSNIKFQQA